MADDSNTGGNERRRKIVEWLLRGATGGRERQSIAADLEELRGVRAESEGKRIAALRYWRDVVWCAVSLRLERRRVRVEREGSGRAGRWLESVVLDTRHAARGLARSPGLAAAVVVTVGLAIGGNTALFTFADALLFRPLPVPDAERLHTLFHIGTEGAPSYSSFSYPDYIDLRESSTAFSGLAAWSAIELQAGLGETMEPIEARIVSGNYFEVLGLRPQLGRTFRPEEDRTPGTHAVVVISRSLWERRLAGDPAAIGRELILNGTPFTVIGVAGPEVGSTELRSAAEAWVPLMMHDVAMPSFSAFGTELFGNRGTHWLDLVGRLADGVDREAAESVVRAVALRQAEAWPETNEGWSIMLVPMAAARLGPPGQQGVVKLTILLAGVVGMVLLIACANVANLLLARSVSRRREMAVRIAIGAHRIRLVRYLLTESILLALAGGAFGLILAGTATRTLALFGVTAELPGLDPRLDLRVLAFTAGLSLLGGIGFGAIPALQESDVRLHTALKDTGAGAGTSRQRKRLRHTLVTVQVAFTLVLLVGAGLTLRTLWNLRAVPLGFETQGLAVATVELPDGYAAERGRAFFRQLEERVAALPGVETVGVARIGPFASGRMANDLFWEHLGDPGTRSRTNTDMNVVDASFFEAMRIPIVRGRPFANTVGAVDGGAIEVVINESLSQRLWPGEDPLGKPLWSWNPNGPDQLLTVVGVARDGRYYRSWRDSGRTFVFLPLSWQESSQLTLHIRGSGAGLPDARDVRAQVEAVDPSVALPVVRSVRDLMADSTALERSTARLLTLFGLLALTIAAIGVYSVVSFSVGERRHEIGLRMALGAVPADVESSVILASAAPIAIGCLIGLAVAAGVTRLMGSLLFGVSATDPATYGLVTAALISIAIMASWVPARRATRLDPLSAMRAD
jgi:putative ABC transport system permease protein